jgi:hypothetical protein
MRKGFSIFLIFAVAISAGCAKKSVLPMQIRHGSEPELTSYLSEARANYFEILRSAAVDYRKKFQPSHPEVMFDYQDSAVPPPYRYRRADLASGAVSPPNVTEIHTDPYRLIEPFTVTHSSGVEVTIFPVVWNAVALSADSVPSDIGPLTAWVWRWIDDGDKKPQDELGFAGIIHSISFPKHDGGVWTTTIDFGSAPVEAFDDLVRTLAQMGVHSIVIRSEKVGRNTPNKAPEPTTPSVTPAADAPVAPAGVAAQL